MAEKKPTEAEASADAAEKVAPKKAPAAKAAAEKAAPKKAEPKAAAEKAAPAEAAAEKTEAKAAPKKAAPKKAEPKKAASTKAAPETESVGSTLRVHHLRPAPGSRTAKTRVGRGEASKGKTAGRGTKGTRARNKVPARFEGGQMPLHMRLPKLRGFKNPFRVEYQVVNLDALAALFPQGGTVTVTDLVDKGAVRGGAPVKVLGTGEVEVKLDLTVQAVSAAARQKIEAAGGTVALD